LIAEKIPNKSSFGRKGFTLPIRYVARDEVDSGKEIPVLMGQVNLDMDINTAEDRELIAMVMNSTAQRAKRLQANPISHWTINWMENEHPDQKQIAQVVKASMSTLGMQNCQAFWAFHQDTDNDHIHLIINRALPDGSVVKEPRRDYLLMDRAMRELEIQQGWNHAHGPWMVRETPEGRKKTSCACPVKSDGNVDC
jgi:Relaxase/Mobilisation nuclease domain.